MSIAPKKHLSQNFLTDQGIARKIVEALPIDPASEVLEIGPGTGALTRWLAASTARRIVAVDIDSRAIAHCKEQPWSANNRVEFVQADVRSISPVAYFDHPPGLLLGNLPYGISSDLLFWILENRTYVSSAVIMLQREVARRLVAKPGSKDYGILSVAIWHGAAVETVMHVQPGSFFPKPSVTSSVVRLTMRPAPPVPVEFSAFQTFVRAAFSQRRKVLSNALKSWAALKNRYLTDTIIPLDKTRAEELQPEELAHLFQRLSVQKKAF